MVLSNPYTKKRKKALLRDAKAVLSQPIGEFKVEALDVNWGIAIDVKNMIADEQLMAILALKEKYRCTKMAIFKCSEQKGWALTIEITQDLES